MFKGRQRQAPATGDALKGADKVAALLLIMGKPLANRIIKQLEDREIRALARSASELPTVGFDQINKLIDELVQLLEVPAAVVGSSQQTQNLLAGVIGDEEINEIMGELAGQPSKKIWSLLAGVADEKLVALLTTEQPQVAATILTNLPVEKASIVFAKLDPALQSDLSARLLALKPIADSASKLLTDRLAQEVFAPKTADTGPNNHARLGAILNRLEPPNIEQILARLAAANPDDARKVGQHVFTFADMAKLLPPDRARLLEDVPVERLVVAIRDCEAALRADALAALSPRSRRLVEAELSSSKPASPQAVSEARMAIAAMARSLIEKSIITSPSEVQAAQNPATNPQQSRP
ncbi:MAG: FliG C-terminal domain-containing protein [Hyphomicrobiaceae bacterium]